MRSSSFFVFFGLLASLASEAVAVTLYRGDQRTPQRIHDEGGFKAKGFSNPEGTLFQHVEGLLVRPSRDPYISTSNDSAVAQRHAGNTGYLYWIDSTQITNPIHDVDAAYRAANKRYGHAAEKEWSVEHLIPWAAITRIQKKNPSGQWQNIVRPTASRVSSARPTATRTRRA